MTNNSNKPQFDIEYLAALAANYGPGWSEGMDLPVGVQYEVGEELERRAHAAHYDAVFGDC